MTEPLAFVTGQLPDLGQDNRLVLMAVDPYLVYAYWNLTSARVEAARALFEQDELESQVLRFHDTTGIDFNGANCGSCFDVKIDLDAGKWYVRLWSPERRYCADIGLRGKDGRLVALVRSNLVETPAAWPHVKVDEAAALVEQGAPEAEAALEPEPLITRPLDLAARLRPPPRNRLPPAPGRFSRGNSRRSRRFARNHSLPHRQETAVRISRTSARRASARESPP